MDYQSSSYCYETPPQEPRYQPLENSKPILTIVEPRANCWEPIISTQVTIASNLCYFPYKFSLKVDSNCNLTERLLDILSE